MLNKPGPNALRVAYCGPIARPGRPARGGYESANRRLIDDLRLHGVDVVEMPYAAPSDGKPVKILAYALGFAARRRARAQAAALRPLAPDPALPAVPLRRGCSLCDRLGARQARACSTSAPEVLSATIENRSFRLSRSRRRMLGRADIGGDRGEGRSAFRSGAARRPDPLSPELCEDGCCARARRPSRTARRLMRIVFLSRVVPRRASRRRSVHSKALLAMGMPASLEIIGSGDEAYVGALARAQASARHLERPVDA